MSINEILYKQYKNKFLYEFSHLIHLFEFVNELPKQEKLYKSVENLDDFFKKNGIDNDNLNRFMADMKLKINKDNLTSDDIQNIESKIKHLLNYVTVNMSGTLFQKNNTENKYIFETQMDFFKEMSNMLYNFNEGIVNKISNGKKVKYYTPFQGPVLKNLKGDTTPR